MTIHLEGELELDPERGVLYFHNSKSGISSLRICGLKGKLDGFSAFAQLDISIPSHMVMRSDAELGPSSARSPIFFLNETHTTHTTKAQARRERAEAKKLDAKVLARADHLLKPRRKRGKT